MSSVITAQPRAQESQQNQDEDVNTVLREENQGEDVNAEEDRKREREEDVAEFCCCVLESAEDAWCLCQCIAACFRGIGHCSDDCCEGCAECISSCCENSGDTNTLADNDCFCCDCSD